MTDIQQKKMPLSALVRPEKNIREHEPAQIKEFVRSVEMFGQIRPIVIDENNVILAGNGLYCALSQLNYEQADVYQISGLSESQKKKLMITDNRISDLGVDNLETFEEFLQELQGDLDIPGYDEEILSQMVMDADEVTEVISTWGTLDEEEIARIKRAEENKERKGERIQEELRKEQEQAFSESPYIPPVSQPTMPQTQSEQTSSSFVRPENPAFGQEPVNNTETAEVRRFVICPHCGEKVYL